MGKPLWKGFFRVFWEEVSFFGGKCPPKKLGTKNIIGRISLGGPSKKEGSPPQGGGFYTHLLLLAEGGYFFRRAAHTLKDALSRRVYKKNSSFLLRGAEGENYLLLARMPPFSGGRNTP